nr:ABC transporter permease subunit [Agitococcus sp.]
MLITVELWQSLWLTIKLAMSATILLMLLTIPLSYYLYYGRSRWWLLIELIVTLPMVLPPTVIGFYLLILFSPQHWFGKVWQQVFDSTLVFSFSGLVIASVLYSLPFALQPMQSAFKQVDESLIEGAVALGATPKQVFYTIVIPVARYGIFSGALLS